MNKIKLTSNLDFKGVYFDNTQFEIPKKVQVDFSSARIRNKYIDGKQTDRIECYVLNGLYENTAKAVEQGLVDFADVKPIVIEVLSESQDVENAIEESGIKFVELIGPKVKALWVNDNKPGYKRFKLVAKDLKLV